MISFDAAHKAVLYPAGPTISDLDQALVCSGTGRLDYRYRECGV